MGGDITAKLKGCQHGENKAFHLWARKFPLAQIHEMGRISPFCDSDSPAPTAEHGAHKKLTTYYLVSVL
jgi:hypothetical protein